MKYRLNITHKKYLSDKLTPVSIYMKLRDFYPNSLLLESSDYHGQENSYSFICCDPIAGLQLNSGRLSLYFPDQKKEEFVFVEENRTQAGLIRKLESFLSRFELTGLKPKFLNPGIFGYTSYDCVRYFEDIRLQKKIHPGSQSGTSRSSTIPDMMYSLYRYIIAVDHFKEELHLVEVGVEGQASKGLDSLKDLLFNKVAGTFQFSRQGEERSDYTDEQYRGMVHSGKQHCQRGDVFQVVLSRNFSQAFTGDEFNVYRALRSVNPSPYLFYFDMGDFKLFGSSPEAQLIIKDQLASIHPIAGTFKRTGDDSADAGLAEKLKKDSKENAEHTMLVDLARNDMSRHCSSVEVEKFREIQFYSHVIHLVSKVTGRLKNPSEALDVLADTFPAGTLSGAPKHKAMQIIDNLELRARGYYGGCVGLIAFNGDTNQAIMIRTFLSKNNELNYQAGAGVVVSSSEEGELQEVNNKLAALKKAIELAETL